MFSSVTRARTGTRGAEEPVAEVAVTAVVEDAEVPTTITAEVQSIYGGMLTLVVQSPKEGEGALPFGAVAKGLIDEVYQAAAQGFKDPQLKRAMDHLKSIWAVTRRVGERPALDVEAARAIAQSFVNELSDLLFRTNKWFDKNWLKQSQGRSKYRELFNEIFSTLNDLTSQLVLVAGEEAASELQEAIELLRSDSAKLNDVADLFAQFLQEMREFVAAPDLASDDRAAMLRTAMASHAERLAVSQNNGSVQASKDELAELLKALSAEMHMQNEATTQVVQETISILGEGLGVKMEEQTATILHKLTEIEDKLAGIPSNCGAIAPHPAHPEPLLPSTTPKRITHTPPPLPDVVLPPAPPDDGPAEAETSDLWDGFLAPKMDELAGLLDDLKREFPDDTMVKALEAWCLWYGGVIGIRKDKKRAKELFNEVDVTELRARAEQNPHAQVLLGEMVFSGKGGLSPDQEAGVKFFMNAAVQGHAVAASNVGFCYHSGKGVPVNHKAAFEWWGKANNIGYAGGHYNLRNC